MDEGIELIKKLLENLDTPNAELNAIWTRESDTRIDAYKLIPSATNSASTDECRIFIPKKLPSPTTLSFLLNPFYGLESFQ